MVTLVAVLTVAILSAVSWVLAVILTCSLYQFYSYKLEMVIIKRRGDIVIKATICAIICFAITFPYGILVYVLLDEKIITQDDNPLHLAIILADDLVYIPYHLGVFLILLRYWLMYYDIQSSKSCLNLQWQFKY